jgi:hypothetical protein
MAKWKFTFDKQSKKMRKDILPFCLIKFFKNEKYDIFPKGVYKYQVHFGWWSWFCALEFEKTLNV